MSRSTLQKSSCHICRGQPYCRLHPWNSTARIAFASFTMSPKTWLVTGASLGIGFQIATHAIALNDVVVATSRNAGNLQPLQRLGCKIAVLDLTWPAQKIRSMVEEILKEVSTIDILVNAAGYILQGCIEETRYICLVSIPYYRTLD